MKNCCKCNVKLTPLTIAKGHADKCRACYAAYMRWLYKTKPDRHLARTNAYKRFKKGIIVKENCVLCGNSDSEMHHPDYSKPNDVVWLCRKCHVEMHELERKALFLHDNFTVL